MDFLEYHHQKTGKKKVSTYNRLRIIFGRILLRTMISGNKIVLTDYIVLRPVKRTENMIRKFNFDIFDGVILYGKKKSFKYYLLKRKKK